MGCSVSQHMAMHLDIASSFPVAVQITCFDFLSGLSELINLHGARVATGIAQQEARTSPVKIICAPNIPAMQVSAKLASLEHRQCECRTPCDLCIGETQYFINNSSMNKSSHAKQTRLY